MNNDPVTPGSVAEEPAAARGFDSDLHAGRSTIDAVPVGIFFLLSIFLFRHHVFGTHTFLGNPDRLNNNLKVLKHHVDGLVTGHLDAWSRFELLGYDTFSLPYTFPNPLTYLAYWLGPDNLYVMAGYVSAALLACSGICAYAFCRSVVRNHAAALVAAILYQFAAITVLKVSQNDMSFAVFILIPLLMLVIRRVGRRSVMRSFLLVSLLLFAMLQFTFLQKAAYAVMLTGTYALYRSWVRKDRRPVLVYAAALSIATIAAFPRLYWLGVATTQYVRWPAGRGHSSYTEIFEQQGISPYEILRWFDGSVFGGHFSDTAAVLNGLNLSEGFLLYTCAMTPFLLVFAILRYRSRWFGIMTEKTSDAAFHFWFLLFTFSVILFKPVIYGLYWLFLGVDFIHARVLIAGLLPLVVLVALVLAELSPERQNNGSTTRQRKSWIWACLLGIVIVFGIEMASRMSVGVWKPYAGFKQYMSLAAISRVLLSGIAATALIVLIRMGNTIDRRRLCHQVLLVCLALQAVVAANDQINSVFNVSTAVPFQRGEISFADRSEFRPPSEGAIRALHQRVRPDLYRSVFVCNPLVAGGFCAAHLGQSWHLRLADGYYGIGLPARIAALPWSVGIGARHIAFMSRQSLPWAVLGLLNVRYAIVANDAFYRNAPANTNREDAEEPEIIENPSSVTPRFFFARAVQPASSPAEAVKEIFKDMAPVDVTQRSFIEGLRSARHFDARGEITVKESGDQLDIMVDRSEHDRFLVLNELYYPGWQAEIDGVSATLYPANVVMRGLLIPQGATSVSLTFQAFPRSAAALGFYAVALVLLVVSAAGFRRIERQL